MTKGTCEPQPHQEDFSRRGWGLASGIRINGEKGSGQGGIRHVEQVPGLHMWNNSRVGAIGIQVSNNKCYMQDVNNVEHERCC